MVNVDIQAHANSYLSYEVHLLDCSELDLFCYVDVLVVDDKQYQLITAKQLDYQTLGKEAGASLHVCVRYMHAPHT